MRDELASELAKWIRDNSQGFQIINSSIFRLHDLSASLALYHPSIALIASEFIDYDTQNHANELYNTLFHIQQDSSFSTIRLALIADPSIGNETLSRLAFFVRDIFLTTENGQLDMNQMIVQLGRPANINNVAQFTNPSGQFGNGQQGLNGFTQTNGFNQQPPQPQPAQRQQPPQYDQYGGGGGYDDGNYNNYNDGYDNSGASFTSSTPPTQQPPTASDEVEKLKKLVELYKAQLLMQKKQNAGDFVPKSDYDNLLDKAREILNQGSNDAQIKDLFQQVMNTNNSYSGKLHEANDMISKQNELINELSAKLQQAEEHQGGRSAETQNLQDQLNEAQREVNTPPNNFNPDNTYEQTASFDPYGNPKPTPQQNNGGYDQPNNDFSGGYDRPSRPTPPPNRGYGNGGYDEPNDYDRPRPRPTRPNSNQRPRPQRPSYDRPPRPSRDRGGTNRSTLPVPVRKKPRKKQPDTPLQKLMKNKILLIGIVGAVALLILLLVVIINRPVDDSNNGVSSSQSSSVDSFDSLIKSGKYDVAAKEYPNRAVDAENKMLDDADVTDKAQFTTNILKVSDSDPIKFDNYYFEEKYPQAVKLLDTSNDPNLKKLSDARRVMASYAYMKDGKISKAEKTAQPLKSEELNKRIKVYKQFKDSNDKLKAKIDSGSLSSSEKKKAQQQIKDNEDKMKKL